MRLISLTALAFAAAVQLGAQERITSYDSQVQIQRDGSIEVTEKIALRAEGNQIRRGIFRDFPTRYRDRFGNRVRVDLEVLGVERNGVMEPWFTERMNNGVRINTGNDDFLPVPADYVFTIRYRTTRQLGFFENNDELYWNAIGTGWVFPIEKGSVDVRLPANVPAEQLSAEAYTGTQGSKGSGYEATTGPGGAVYRLTQPLSPYEGFTTVLTFPKGIVTAPTEEEKTRLFFKDNRGVLVSLVGLVALLGYMFTQWRRVGRDPKKGIIIARYEPGEGHTAAGLRFMKRMGYDTRSFTADVLALAIGGHLRIHREDKLFKDEWRLERISSQGAADPSPAQALLLNGLFTGGKETLVLKNTNATTVAAARQKHQKALDTQYHPRYFRRNTKNTVIAVLAAMVITGIALAVSGGFGVPFIVVLGALMMIGVAVFAWLVRAPTQEGRDLLDEIEGLKLYMSVAERQELAGLRGPGEPVLDAKQYEAMLPYAVALDVEDAWTEKFTAAAGAAAAVQAAQHMSWYSGRGGISSLGDFTSSVSSGLNSTISSASSPPGSSSGSGGGGSSGGGGGGGGGGGR